MGGFSEVKENWKPKKRLLNKEFITVERRELETHWDYSWGTILASILGQAFLLGETRSCSGDTFDPNFPNFFP